MSRKQVDKIVALALQPLKHGAWRDFALAEGLTRDAVFHCRKKLGLPVRGPKAC